MRSVLMLNVAVIGLGAVSNVHIPAIHTSKSAQLVAVCDSNESLEKEIPDVPFYTDYETMLENEDLDVVHICLPHHLHLPVTKACVEKGIHVYLEKPLAKDLQEAKALVELEQAHPEIKICVSLQNRYNETVEELLKITKQNKYGDLLGVKGIVSWFRPKSYYEAQPWRGELDLAGGGVMINQSIHTLDLLQVFGGEMTSIRGSVDQLLDYDIEVEDTATARIEFENGATGLFFATIANSNNSSVELEVTYDKATFTIKDSILVKEEQGIKETIIEDNTLPGTKFYYGASHAKLINHFYNCIIADQNDYVHAQEALTSMEMIALIQESSRQQKTLPLEK